MPKLKEECGVFGIYDHKAAANLAYLGLYSLQHRGQESAGIVSTDGKKLYHYRKMGLVTEVFDESSIAKLKGTAAIGHVRYST
ncbi:MAG: amidophosphoribosyltransferase, partial [Thermodesulfobacteriota bacterium]